MAVKDGYGDALLRDTIWDGQTQKLTMPDPANPDKIINKGLRRIGHERGLRSHDGRVTATFIGPLNEDQSERHRVRCALLKFEMVALLSDHSDFSSAAKRSILQTAIEEAGSQFHFLLDAKFWCNLAWVEIYWNDVKRITRDICDGTMPNLTLPPPPHT